MSDNYGIRIERHYSVNSAAELLDVSSKTIRREIKRKNLKVSRVAGRIRIAESEVSKILIIQISSGEIATAILSKHSGEKYGKD